MNCKIQMKELLPPFAGFQLGSWTSMAQVAEAFVHIISLPNQVCYVNVSVWGHSDKHSAIQWAPAQLEVPPERGGQWVMPRSNVCIECGCEREETVAEWGAWSQTLCWTWFLGATSSHRDITISALELTGPGEQTGCINWWRPGWNLQTTLHT